MNRRQPPPLPDAFAEMVLAMEFTEADAEERYSLTKAGETYLDRMEEAA